MTKPWITAAKNAYRDNPTPETYARKTASEYGMTPSERSFNPNGMDMITAFVIDVLGNPVGEWPYGVHGRNSFIARAFSDYVRPSESVFDDMFNAFYRIQDALSEGCIIEEQAEDILIAISAKHIESHLQEFRRNPANPEFTPDGEYKREKPAQWADIKSKVKADIIRRIDRTSSEYKGPEQAAFQEVLESFKR